MQITYRKKQPDGTWLESHITVSDDRWEEVVDRAFVTFTSHLPFLEDPREILARMERLRAMEKKGKRR